MTAYDATLETTPELQMTASFQCLLSLRSTTIIYKTNALPRHSVGLTKIDCGLASFELTFGTAIP